MSRGLFIVLEGIDGSGLSTQAHSLHRTLARQGQPSVLTKEPTTGPVGKLLRRALGDQLSVSEETMGLLFAADRREHVRQTILPQLLEGIHVICDRYYLSSLAYQSRTVSEDWLWHINSFALIPDVTIFINLPVQEAMKRIDSRGLEREVYEEASILNAIRNVFCRLLHEKAERAGKRIMVVDGRPGIRDVAACITKGVLPLTDQQRSPLTTLGGDVIG